MGVFIEGVMQAKACIGCERVFVQQSRDGLKRRRLAAAEDLGQFETQVAALWPFVAFDE